MPSPSKAPPTRAARRVRMAVRLAQAFLTDPVGVIRALPGHIRMQMFHAVTDQADPHWDEHMHQMLGLPWPCPEAEQVTGILSEANAQLAAKGLAVGRQVHGGYSDADATLAQAVWCAVRHRRPNVVVETGVARGVTSRVVLEALEQNDRGRLWSIDLPHPLDHSVHRETGAAVTDRLRSRWTYVEGTSQQRLPEVIHDVQHVDVFIHDSLHTAKNTRFELDRAAEAMPRGGVMLADDISTHDGFATFARDHAAFETIVCPAADQEGQFGVAVKTGGLMFTSRRRLRRTRMAHCAMDRVPCRPGVAGISDDPLVLDGAAIAALDGARCASV